MEAGGQMSVVRSVFAFVGLVILILLALVFGAGRISCYAQQVGDHGVGHAENHDWYRDLHQPGTGYSCCNGTANGIEGDCRPTRAYLQDDGTWRALVDGHWVNVPPRVVLQRLTPDGNSHICASRSGMIYCFIGGSPKS
jgi:hypothetical protein